MRKEHNQTKQDVQPVPMRASARERMSFKDWPELYPKLIAEVEASKKCSLSDIGWLFRRG